MTFVRMIAEQHLSIRFDQRTSLRMQGEFEGLAEAIRGEFPGGSLTQYAPTLRREAVRTVRNCAPELIDAVEQERAGEGEGIVHVTGLPVVAELPPTPVDGHLEDDQLMIVSDAVPLAVYDAMAAPVLSFPFENDGRPVRNVIAHPDAGNTVSSWGHRKRFSYHTDNPSCRFPFEEGLGPVIPSFLAFTGHRNLERVATKVVDLDRVLAALLAQRVIDVLAEPEFEIAGPDSNDGVESLTNVALLSAAPSGRVYIRFDPNCVTPLTERAADAIQELQRVLSAVQPHQFVLDAGEFLLFDNTRFLHARDAFLPCAPWWQSRWLRRWYGGQPFPTVTPSPDGVEQLAV